MWCNDIAVSKWRPEWEYIENNDNASLIIEKSGVSAMEEK